MPGNTPLHLAMESAHAEAACLLIEAGADRTRVSVSPCWNVAIRTHFVQDNLDGETPESQEGVGGQEQKRARDYIVDRCGKAQ